MTGGSAVAPALPVIRLRLFLGGASPLSQRAMVDLHAISDRYLAGRTALEIIDIYQHPALAEANQVIAVPTLLNIAPLPLRRIVGDLSDVARMLRALDLPQESSDQNVT